MTDTVKELESKELAEVPYDAGDPKQVNEARKKAGRRKKLTLGYKMNQQSPQGLKRK